VNRVVRNPLIAAGSVLFAALVIGFGYGTPHIAVVTGTVAVCCS
jgi:hypothetical protein